MKLTANKNKTFSLTGLTRDELVAILTVVQTANDRCFCDKDDDGHWYSNDDFVCFFTDSEREALRSVCDKINQ